MRDCLDEVAQRALSQVFSFNTADTGVWAVSDVVRNLAQHGPGIKPTVTWQSAPAMKTLLGLTAEVQIDKTMLTRCG